MEQNRIMIIPAKRQIGNNIKEAEKPKLRVAAYCRVSTDSEEQASSYEAQIQHYTEYIAKNPDWQLAGIFADDGISGTNTKHRVEFNRLIEECMSGNIDMVITKSISRFARNTLDCLKYIRKLKDKNIPVYFEKESINTMDAKGEVLLTIMASLAQQESQSLSQNVKLGLQYRYQQGQIQINHNKFLGYTKNDDGKLIIEPKQAEVVKRIYREYLLGFSMNRIASGLEADGILTGAGKKKWWTSTIRKILSNEKYIGDALLQKTYTTDFLTKARVKNTGLMPQYYVEGNHEAIIPKETFMLAQEELAKRQVTAVSPNGRKRSYSSNSCFSNIIFCGHCREVFCRVHWYRHKTSTVVWRCASRLEDRSPVCYARSIKEETLHQIVIEALNRMLLQKSNYLDILQKNITTVIKRSDTTDIALIDEKLLTLQQELLRRANNREAYNNIADEIFHLRELRAKAESNTVLRDDTLKRITELCDFLKEQPQELTAFDELLTRRILDSITVYDDHVTVKLKSGISLDIDE